MGADNGNGNGGPWWVRVVSQFGVPAAIAIFLVWFVTGQQAAKLDAITAQMNAAQANMSQFVMRQGSFETEVRAENAWKLSLLRQICLNTAKNEADRRACVVR